MLPIRDSRHFIFDQLRLVLGLAWVAVFALGLSLRAEDTRPNIVWIIVDDLSPNFSCYGEKSITTPNVDRLAAEGIRFTKAFVTGPVCSISRSAMITGMYQTSIGAHNHRSGRGEIKIQLPEEIVPIPILMQKAGYYTCNGSIKTVNQAAKVGNAPRAEAPIAKTDYNFEYDPAMYDSADWSGRKEGQPFFMQVQLTGGKMRGAQPLAAKEKFEAKAMRQLNSLTDPTGVTPPPYYPRDPVILQDWASYLDSIRITDAEVGVVIERLEREGILDQTLIVFMPDHGISHARAKQFLYDAGTQVALVMRGPGIVAGQVRTDLVQQIDVTAFTLVAAGIPVPAYMQGQNMMAKDYQAKKEVFSARDRCDETVDKIRSLRTDRYLYIRNYLPKRPLLQPNAYKDGKEIIQDLRAAHEADTLSPLSEKLLFSSERPDEELYDCLDDPWQMNNLAADVTYAETLADLRVRLDAFLAKTGDPDPESEAMYDSDMTEYLKKDKHAQEIRDNIHLMKQWAAEGK